METKSEHAETENKSGEIIMTHNCKYPGESTSARHHTHTHTVAASSVQSSNLADNIVFVLAGWNNDAGDSCEVWSEHFSICVYRGGLESNGEDA